MFYGLIENNFEVTEWFLPSQYLMLREISRLKENKGLNKEFLKFVLKIEF